MNDASLYKTPAHRQVHCYQRDALHSLSTVNVRRRTAQDDWKADVGVLVGSRSTVRRGRRVHGRNAPVWRCGRQRSGRRGDPPHWGVLRLPRRQTVHASTGIRRVQWRQLRERVQNRLRRRHLAGRLFTGWKLTWTSLKDRSVEKLTHRLAFCFYRATFIMQPYYRAYPALRILAVRPTVCLSVRFPSVLYGLTTEQYSCKRSQDTALSGHCVNYFKMWFENLWIIFFRFLSMREILDKEADI